MTLRVLRIAPLLLACLVPAACGAQEGASTAGEEAFASGEADAPTPRPPASNAAPPAAPGGGLDLDALGYTVGDEDAPVRVVEFSDFGCGYCRQFHMETWPALQDEYVESGKVLWKYVPMILGIFGPNAQEAAWAGECALEQDRFPAMQDALFEHQGDWRRARDAVALFRRYAGEVGLDVERWRTCMGEGWRHERVAEGTRLSRELGVRGTPTFFVMGYGTIPGAIPLDLFRKVLDEAHAEAVGGGGPAAPR